MRSGLPERTWQSVLFTVVACTLIRTSSSFGTGTLRSFTLRSPGKPYLVRTAAFIFVFYVNNDVKVLQDAGYLQIPAFK
jgi:hypothetical protein